MERLSKKLETWKPLGRKLGFQEGELNDVDEDNQNVSEKKFEMLKKWKQRKGKKATYGVLYHALCYETVQRKDLAQNFCCQ